MNPLLYGLITGILFGFFLQRGQVLRYDKQIGALRLLDMTIVKFMLSAILVGTVGIYLLLDLGLVKLSVKPTILGGVIAGGMLFGLGWGLLGYCPGTAVGAVGEDFGKITLPEIFGVSHWVVIPVFLLAGIALFYVLEKKGL